MKLARLLCQHLIILACLKEYFMASKHAFHGLS